MVSFASRQRENWRIVLPITISEVTTQNPYFGLKKYRWIISKHKKLYMSLLPVRQGTYSFILKSRSSVPSEKECELTNIVQ